VAPRILRLTPFLLPFRCPGEDRFAVCGDFVEAADARAVRRGLDDLGISAGLFGDGDHRIAEGIEALAALVLGRLDHHRPVHDEGEVDGHRVEAVVHQALGDVECGDAGLLQQLVVEDHLVQ